MRETTFAPKLNRRSEQMVYDYCHLMIQMMKKSFQKPEDKLILKGLSYRNRASEAKERLNKKETEPCTFRPTISTVHEVSLSLRFQASKKVTRRESSNERADSTEGVLSLKESRSSKHSRKSYCGFTFANMKSKLEEDKRVGATSTRSRKNSRSRSREQLFDGLYKDAKLKEEKAEQQRKKQYGMIPIALQVELRVPIQAVDFPNESRAGNSR